MIRTFVHLNKHFLSTVKQTCRHLNAPEDAFLARAQQAQAAVLPHLAFAVVVVDARGDAQAAGLGAGAPRGGLDQTVLLPG